MSATSGSKQSRYLRSGVVPVQEHRNDRGPSVQCETRQTRRRARGDSEEINEYSFGEQRIVIGQNPHRALIAQNLQNGPRRLIFFDRQIPAEAAIFRDERVDAWIIDGPHQKMQWMSVAAPGRTAPFPTRSCGR